MMEWYINPKWFASPAKRPFTSIVKKLGYNEIYPQNKRSDLSVPEAL